MVIVVVVVVVLLLVVVVEVVVVVVVVVVQLQKILQILQTTTGTTTTTNRQIDAYYIDAHKIRNYWIGAYKQLQQILQKHNKYYKQLQQQEHLQK